MRHCRLIIFCFLLAYAPLWSQTADVQSGILTGVVASTSGETVAHAHLTITNVASGEAAQALTAADGSFSIKELTPGAYRIEVEIPAYSRLVQESVVVNGPGTTQVRLVVTPGSAEQTVNATGHIPLLQRESGQRSHSFDTRSVRELPIVDRNYQELVRLIPGVTPPATTSPVILDPQQNRIFHSNGQAFNTNKWNLEGFHNTEPARHLSQHLTPVEAIQQMNVRNSSQQPEVGAAAGSLVNTELRSGDKEYHGSAYWFHGIDELGARDFFNTQPNDEAEFRSNQFGATFGGPVPSSDKLFFFANYEGMFVDYQRPQFSTVPSTAFREGDFSSVTGLTLYDPATGDQNGLGRAPFPGNRIPANRFGDDVRTILGAFPDPNQAGVENNLLSFAPLRNDSHRSGARGDYRWSDNTSLFGHYQYGKYFVSDDDPRGRAISQGGEARVLNQHASLGWAHAFSPNLVTDLRGTYDRFRNNMNGFNDRDRIEISGMPGIGAPRGLPMNWIDNAWHVANSWSWNPNSRHSFRFGGDVTYLRVDDFRPLNAGFGRVFEFEPGPTASPNNFAFPSAGVFPNSFASFFLSTPTVATDTLELLDPSYRRWFYSGFVNDTFRVHQKLTFDFGIRYELFSPVSPANDGGLSNFDPITNTIQLAGLGEIDHRADVDWDYTNFSPRFGFAYQLGTRSVLRGGYSYNYFPNSVGFAIGSLFPALSSVQEGIPGTYLPAGALPAIPFPSVPATGTVTADLRQPLSFISSDSNTASVQNYNFTYAMEISDGMMFDVAYVGSLGRQLPYRREFNAAPAGGGTAALPLNSSLGRTARTIETANEATNNYNALQASVTKRFSNRLGFTAAYTWSKALDEVTGESYLLNNIDRQRNYGLADFDRKHMFTFSHIWELPFGTGTDRWNSGLIGQLIGGWQLNGILTWVSGTPFSVTANPLLCNCPGNSVNFANVRREPETTGGLGPGSIGDGRFFETAAFEQPTAETFGNATRNSIRGPELFNYDVSVFRSQSITEGTKIEFRAEFYNITNSSQFANPIGNLDSEDFGRIISTLAASQGRFGSGRRVNFALRLLF